MTSARQEERAVDDDRLDRAARPRTPGAAVGAGAVCAIGLVLALFVVNAVVSWPVSPATTFRYVAAATFLVAGATTLVRWPDNRTGWWMLASSAGLLVEQLFWGWTPVKGFTALSDVSTPLILTMGLAFPAGRLTRPARWIVAVEWLLAVGEPLARQLGLIDGRFRDGADLAEAAVCMLVIGVLARRYSAASRPMRRVLAPGYSIGAGMLLAGFAIVGTDLTHAQQLHDGLVIVFGVLRAVLPVAFVVGLGWLRRDAAVGVLLTGWGSGDVGGSLDDAVRTALGDPAARVVTGVAADEPPGGALVRTPIEVDGSSVGALVHDRGVDGFTARSVAAALGLVLYNARLRDEAEQRAAELGAAAARLVEATDAARRQVERNLHDGAQQRLVAVGVQLRLLQAELTGRGADRDAREVGVIADQLSAALTELRTLAKGMSPSVLARAGLVSALRTLAAESPLQVELVIRDEVAHEPPAAAVSTLYYATAEALTNAAKHSGADRVAIEMTVDDAAATVTVRDYGRGGADRCGSGLRGIEDRARLLGGDMRVADVADGGTEVVVTVPMTEQREPGQRMSSGVQR